MTSAPKTKKFELPRRKLSEVVERLRREPQVRELYVEGIYDRDFYRSALTYFGVDDVHVYPIETIEVPDELLQELQLTRGQRQRVEAAAKKIEEYPEVYAQVALLIDSDLDYLLDRPLRATPLIRTDTSCAEVILWRKDVLERFFSIALARQNAVQELDVMMPAVENVVSEAFLFRAAKELVVPTWHHIEVAEVISNKIAFSLDVYCEKLASKNSAHKELREKVIPTIADLRPKSQSLPVEKRMQGHDLMSVLCKIAQFSGYQHGCLSSGDELGRLLMASVDWATLQHDVTLRSLRAKFPRQQSRK
jgi:hypothetical protein